MFCWLVSSAPTSFRSHLITYLIRFDRSRFAFAVHVHHLKQLLCIIYLEIYPWRFAEL